jgi:IS30 family transposase
MIRAAENTNGLIRQYLPKGEGMLTLTQRKCDLIAEKLNRRPRKRVQFPRPERTFPAFL